VFALLGLRQTQPLFTGSLNSHTGIGYATISFAFGVAQLTWGVHSSWPALWRTAGVRAGDDRRRAAACGGQRGDALPAVSRRSRC
jgi:hypothetical protein